MSFRLHTARSVQCPVAQVRHFLPKLFQCNAFNLRDDFATFGKLKTVPRHSCDVRRNPVSCSVVAETIETLT